MWYSQLYDIGQCHRSCLHTKLACFSTSDCICTSILATSLSCTCTVCVTHSAVNVCVCACWYGFIRSCIRPHESVSALAARLMCLLPTVQVSRRLLIMHSKPALKPATIGAQYSLAPRGFPCQFLCLGPCCLRHQLSCQSLSWWSNTQTPWGVN